MLNKAAVREDTLIETRTVRIQPSTKNAPVLQQSGSKDEQAIPQRADAEGYITNENEDETGKAFRSTAEVPLNFPVIDTKGAIEILAAWNNALTAIAEGKITDDQIKAVGHPVLQEYLDYISKDALFEERLEFTSEDAYEAIADKAERTRERIRQAIASPSLPNRNNNDEKTVSHVANPTVSIVEEEASNAKTLLRVDVPPVSSEEEKESPNVQRKLESGRLNIFFLFKSQVHEGMPLDQARAKMEENMKELKRTGTCVEVEEWLNKRTRGKTSSESFGPIDQLQHLIEDIRARGGYVKPPAAPVQSRQRMAA